MNAGIYVLSITTIPEDNYESVTVNTTVTVNKANPNMILASPDILAGNVALITVNLPNDATGTVTITVNGVEYNESARNPISLTIVDLETGNYVVNAVYYGDSNYLSSQQISNFLVTNENETHITLNPEITIDVNDSYYGEDVIIFISANESLTDNITVTLAGKTYTVLLTNGKGNLIIPNLNVGTYFINAVFKGNDNYMSGEINSTFAVNKANTEISDISVMPDFNTTITVTVNGSDNDVVYIVIDGNNYSAVINGGIASISITLENGNYEVTAYYFGNDNYNGASPKSLNFTTLFMVKT